MTPKKKKVATLKCKNYPMFPGYQRFYCTITLTDLNITNHDLLAKSTNVCKLCPCFFASAYWDESQGSANSFANTVLNIWFHLHFRKSLATCRRRQNQSCWHSSILSSQAWSFRKHGTRTIINSKTFSSNSNLTILCTLKTLLATLVGPIILSYFINIHHVIHTAVMFGAAAGQVSSLNQMNDKMIVFVPEQLVHTELTLLYPVTQNQG